MTSQTVLQSVLTGRPQPSATTPSYAALESNRSASSLYSKHFVQLGHSRLWFQADALDQSRSEQVSHLK